MPISPPFPCRRCAILPGVAVAAALLFGCQQNDDVQHYQAPRAETPMIRLRVAIFKAGEQTWFFKLLGPKDVVDLHADDFEEFLRSVKFTSAGKEPVTWIAPAGWEKEASDGQRYATYQIGKKEPTAELTVVPLEGQAGSLLANVNRWRGQLGLKAVADDELKEICTESTIGEHKVTRVEMTASGRFRKTAVPKMPIGKVPSKKPIAYDTPEGWNEMPTPPQFAVAGFQLRDGPAQAQVSITPMTAQPELDNVNRWRMQAGLDPVGPDALGNIVQPFEVGTAKAKTLDMTGSRTRIVVVMLPHGGSTWIFKMNGDADLVGKHKPAFEKFVRSVRFDGGSDE